MNNFVGLSLLQIDPLLSTNSAVSIGLMVTILGAAVFLSRSLTRTEEQLKRINEKLAGLERLPQRMAHVENHISNLELDLNNLWVAYRHDHDIDVHDFTRRERGPIRKIQKETDDG